MEWREKGNHSYKSYKNGQVNKTWLSGLVLLINNKEFIIEIPGSYTVRKRKLISPFSSRFSYKILIEDFFIDSKYLGVFEGILDTKINPVIQTKGQIFNPDFKKILVDRKKQKITFSIDEHGVIGI